MNQFIEEIRYYAVIKYLMTSEEKKLIFYRQLIKKHFELVEKYEMLENTYSMICEDYLNPKPYKFEDLQTEMQVYDNCLKECIEDQRYVWKKVEQIILLHF